VCAIVIGAIAIVLGGLFHFLTWQEPGPPQAAIKALREVKAGMAQSKAKRLLRDAEFELSSSDVNDAVKEFYEYKVTGWCTRLHLKDGKVVSTDGLFRVQGPPVDIWESFWNFLRILNPIR